MEKYITLIKNTLSGLSLQSDGIALKNVRWEKLVYFAAYALELMLFSARGLFLPMGASIGSLSGWTVAQVFHAASSLAFMLLWKDNFKPHIKTAVGIMLGGFIPFIFLPYGSLRLIFGIIFYIGLGGAVTAARCGFAFALNNSERFFGMLLMFLAVAVFRTVNFLGAEGIIVTYIIPLALLSGLCLCLLKFSPEDFTVKEISHQEDKKGIYWALAFFILYFSVDGYRSELTDSGEKAYLFMCLGMVAAGLCLFLLFAVLKQSTLHLWNVFFIFTVAFALFTGFSQQPETDAPLNFFSGLTLLGWPLCIYTLACAQRKFASYSLMKKCTVIFVIASPLTTFSSDLIHLAFPHSFKIIAMVYLIGISIAFLIFSPYSFKHLFSSLWIKDITKTDMEFPQENPAEPDRFEGFDLTPRQKQIAALLLEAKTRRQIAGELCISESTVKMHVSDLYRKLNISSKAELFMCFTQESSD